MPRDRPRRSSGCRFDGRHSAVLAASSRRSSSTTASAWRRFRASGVACSFRWPWRRACASAPPGSIAGIAPFRGRSAPSPAPHDAPPSLWLGPLILGAVGVVLGVLPALAAGPIALADGISHGTRSTVTLGLWHGFTITLAAERADARGFGRSCSRSRARLWRLRWPAALQTERLYTFALAALDRAEPPRRSRAAERVAAFVRAHRRGRRRSHWSALALATDGAPSAAAALDADRVPRSRAGGTHRRRQRCRPRSPARAWPRSCRSARSGTALR